MMFPKLKANLCEKKFSSNDELIQAVEMWYAEVGQNFFQETDQVFEQRYTKCINVEGDYVVN